MVGGTLAVEGRETRVWAGPRSRRSGQNESPADPAGSGGALHDGMTARARFSEKRFLANAAFLREIQQRTKKSRRLRPWKSFLWVRALPPNYAA